MAAGTFLIGGGWTPAHRAAGYGAFLDRADVATPTVACVVLDEGDGHEQFERWAGALTATGPCRPVPVLIPVGSSLRIEELADADALLICGGLTPGYAAAVAPAAASIRDWLGVGRPYAGFSAGAAVAAAPALVGGWRWHGRPVCPEDAGEELDELAVAPGLGLVPFAVDVHTAQWGTLPRLVTAVTAGLVARGVAVDEDTVLVDGQWVDGAGHCWCVGPDGAAGARVVRVAAGNRLPDGWAS